MQKSHWAIIPLAGVVTLLSAVFWIWPNGVRGALMAMVIAAGVWWLSRQKTPAIPMAIIVGLASGLAGGALAALLQWAIPDPVRQGELRELYPPEVPLWALVVSGALYGLFLVPFYWKFVRPARWAFFWILAAGVGCGLIRTGMGTTYFPDPGYAILTGLFGGVPFGILWMWVARAWGGRVGENAVAARPTDAPADESLTSPPEGTGTAAT